MVEEAEVAVSRWQAPLVTWRSALDRPLHPALRGSRLPAPPSCLTQSLHLSAWQ